jgi:hypothetical protein
MPCVCLPVLTCRGIASDLVAGEDPGGSLTAEAPAQYRPRHPEQTEFYQLFEDHFDSYVRGYEEGFAPRSGPLRPVVVRSVIRAGRQPISAIIYLGSRGIRSVITARAVGGHRPGINLRLSPYDHGRIQYSQSSGDCRPPPAAGRSGRDPNHGALPARNGGRINLS